jgi:hypothetical protein
MKYNKMKGQSAIEYLTTYGWMLLVIAIVGGAIFTTVQNSAQIQSVSGLTNADVQVSDYGLNDDGLQLSLRSASADQVNIQKVSITDTETGVSADISPSQVVPVGDTATVNLQDVQTTDTSDEYNMEITYDTGGLEGLTAEGQITGSFGVFNRISLQNTKFNRSTNELQIEVENTGENTADSIDYTVEANNKDYTGKFSNLDAGEKAQINVSTDETYPLESVSLDTEGTRFVDSSSGLKCTPTQGLVGYWTFNQEQTQNGYAIDISGQGNNASITDGSIRKEDGIVGGAYQFEETSDYLELSKNISFSSGFTINLYSYHTSFDDNDWDNYFNQHQVWLRKDSNDEGNKVSGFIANDDSQIGGTDNWLRLSTDESLKTDEWNNIGFTWNATEAEIYLESNIDSSASWSKDLINSKVGPTIGAGERTGKDNHHMQGYIDEFRIYNRSLSQQEIQRLYEVRSEDWAVSSCKLRG